MRRRKKGDREMKKKDKVMFAILICCLALAMSMYYFYDTGYKKGVEDKKDFEETIEFLNDERSFYIERYFNSLDRRRTEQCISNGFDYKDDEGNCCKYGLEGEICVDFLTAILNHEDLSIDANSFFNSNANATFIFDLEEYDETNKEFTLRITNSDFNKWDCYSDKMGYEEIFEIECYGWT